MCSKNITPICQCLAEVSIEAGVAAPEAAPTDAQKLQPREALGIMVEEYFLVHADEDRFRTAMPLRHFAAIRGLLLALRHAMPIRERTEQGNGRVRRMKTVFHACASCFWVEDGEDFKVDSKKRAATVVIFAPISARH
jgi:hypothetical protein